MVKILLDSGADFGTKDDDGFTPLHGAASWDQVGMVKMLLAAGAKVDASDGIISGRTPLMEAVRHGNRATVEFLLDAGANIDVQDDMGNTALMLVIDTNRSGCKCNFCSELTVRSDLIRMLVLRGANLSLKNTQGQSAIDIAKNYVGNDRADIISVLKSA